MYPSVHDHDQPRYSVDFQYQSPSTLVPGIPGPNLVHPYAPHMATSPHVSGMAGKWSTGLCHCCDDPENCVITCLCPCVTFGQIAEIVNRGFTSCAKSGVVYGVLLAVSGFACLYFCLCRSKMRAQYDLQEALCGDCLVHWCCETCALCQEYRELKNRELDMPIGWEANMDRRQRGITVVAIMPPDMTR